MGGQVSHRRTPAQSVADTPEQIKQWAKEQILAVGKLDSRRAGAEQHVQTKTVDTALRDWATPIIPRFPGKNCN